MLRALCRLAIVVAYPSVASAHPAAVGLPAPRPQPTPLSLTELQTLAIQKHPRLAVRAFEVDAARGRALQAGLYPNPTVSVQGEEMGSRDGPGGIITGPQVSQQIVTAGKLPLRRAAELRGVDQATLQLLSERYVVLTQVRQAYYEALTAQRRVEILTDLTRLAGQSVEVTQKQVEAKQAARLNLLQLTAEFERLSAEERAARREFEAAFRRMAATAGVPELLATSVSGSLEAQLPEYDFERAAAAVRSTHPNLRAAQAGVARAQLLLRRAEVEPIPNVSASTGYVRNNIDRGDQWTFQLSVPVPLFDRNQGNIHSARASLGQAGAQMRQAEVELMGQLATAFGEYAAARERIERYQRAVLPNVRESLELSRRAYQGGQFEYLRVLEAQRAVIQATLEYNRALGDAWRAASQLGGLLLEEEWPGPTPPPAMRP